MKQIQKFGHKTVGGGGGGSAQAKVNLYQLVAGKELSPVPYEGLKKVAGTLPTVDDPTSEWIEKIDIDTPIIETDGVGVARRMDDYTLFLVWGGQESTINTDMINGQLFYAFSTVQSPYLDTTVTPNISGFQSFLIPTTKVV